MKNLKKKALVSAMAGVFAFGAGFYAAPNTAVPALTLMQAAEASAQWEQGTITAEGFGTPPAGSYGSKASIMARRAAIVDAQRNLAEQINGVQVDAETTVMNFVTTSDIIKSKVSALIKGAVVVEEQAMMDGSYRVVMSMPMYGTQGLATAILPAIRENTPPAPPPSMRAAWGSSPASPPSSMTQAAVPFTVSAISTTIRQSRRAWSVTPPASPLHSLSRVLAAARSS